MGKPKNLKVKITTAKPATSAIKKGKAKPGKVGAGLGGKLASLKADTNQGIEVLLELLQADVTPYARAMPSPKVHDPRGNLPKMVSLDPKSKLARVYRNLWAGQDEFVRTSLTVDIFMAMSRATLGPTDYDRLIEFMSDISALRFPTKWVGYKFANPSINIGGFNSLQHPTSPGTGIWDPKIKGGSSSHAAFDQARVRRILDVINSHLEPAPGGGQKIKAGVTLESFGKTILREAIMFTLNHVAPATAGNVASSANPKDKVDQMQAREYLKDVAVKLGAPRRPQPLVPKLVLPAHVADFIPQDGSISPRRDNVTFNDFETIVGAHS